MEYVVFEKQRKGLAMFRDMVKVKDGIVRHIQVENRRGYYFMRSKIRKI